MTTAFDEFMAELVAVHTGLDRLKERAMVYQVERKERLAKEHGKPINAYYGLSYWRWVAIRDAD
jgi:hypothetical protein